MNHFKGKQFQKDVIIISVGYYLRYNLSYRDVQEMLLTFLTQQFTVGFKNMVSWSIKSGKRKIDSPFSTNKRRGSHPRII